jgi:hypothetical protein
MDNERPANFSFEDAYLQVADICDRAEFRERIAGSHALGELRISGLPNRNGVRQDIPPLVLIDYRLAFGTGGRDAMAVRTNLAARWLPADDLKPPRRSQRPLSFRAARDLDWRFAPHSTPAPQPGRLLLAENATEIDERAYRAIRRACARAKPGDAPAAFTDLQLGRKEFDRFFRKTAAKAPRPISEHDMREMLQLAVANKEPEKVFGVRDAQNLLNKTGRPYNRQWVRNIMKELSFGRRRGRPPKVIK